MQIGPRRPVKRGDMGLYLSSTMVAFGIDS